MTDAPNAAEAEYWSGPSGASWIENETEMDRVLEAVVRVLRERAGDVAGLKVLDIGCGTGAVSMAFAAAGARVTASDIAQPFLDRVADRSRGQIPTLLADAQTAVWPSAFDLAVSRFGVMFFTDPRAAFANIARALRPGGRMILAAWGPFDENPWWHVPQSIATRRMGVEPSRPDPHAPGPMGLSDMEWSLERMRNADLADVACDVVDTTLNYPGGAAGAGELATRLGPGARVLRLNDAGEADRDFVAGEIAVAYDRYADGAHARIPACLYIYSARRV